MASPSPDVVTFSFIGGTKRNFTRSQVEELNIALLTTMFEEVSSPAAAAVLEIPISLDNFDLVSSFTSKPYFPRNGYFYSRLKFYAGEYGFSTATQDAIRGACESLAIPKILRREILGAVASACNPGERKVYVQFNDLSVKEYRASFLLKALPELSMRILNVEGFSDKYPLSLLISNSEVFEMVLEYVKYGDKVLKDMEKMFILGDDDAILHMRMAAIYLRVPDLPAKLLSIIQSPEIKKKKSREAEKYASDYKNE